MYIQLQYNNFTPLSATLSFDHSVTMRTHTHLHAHTRVIACTHAHTRSLQLHFYKLQQ